jgi:hypothetical protein
MVYENEVTRIAQELYPQIFTDTSKLELLDKEKINIADNCADTLCKRWQELVLRIPHQNHLPEATVAGNSPIDILDTVNGIAYELKYSHKNVKHEFYKDLFKVLIFNQELENKIKITRFVFLCHYKGISSLLRSSLCMATIKFMNNQGITVDLVELFPNEEILAQAA